MKDKHAAVADSDHLLHAFAAELTVAAYSTALRHGVADNWLDLELDLWRVLTAAVKKWGQDFPRAGIPGIPARAFHTG